MPGQSLKKRIIILKHNGGRLGNQLLLLVSVYAFCLEKKYELVNYSFYNYRKYFNFKEKDLFISIVNFLGWMNLYRNHRSHLIIYYLFSLSADIYRLLVPGKTIRALREPVTFLPPTNFKKKSNIDLVKSVTQTKDKTIYLEGWTFRNPTGIKKYYQEIRAYLKPKNLITKNIRALVKPLRRRYSNLIGVHIRQGDHKIWQGGKYYFDQDEVAAILKFFLKKYKLDLNQAGFLICSDGTVDINKFKGLNVYIGQGSLIEDLYSLSECDFIIGSDSTFGKFAAYYGNKPLYFFDRKKKVIKQPYGF